MSQTDHTVMGVRCHRPIILPWGFGVTDRSYCHGGTVSQTDHTVMGVWCDGQIIIHTVMGVGVTDKLYAVIDNPCLGFAFLAVSPPDFLYTSG